MNPLSKLHAKGQSYWMDFIRRDLMQSGELKKLVAQDGLRGMTSNPTIFQKALASGAGYDTAIKKLALKGNSEEEIFWSLAIDDIQAAADVIRPVYDESGGKDGFVSLEVDPNLAYDTAGTLADAKKLFKKVGRPNLMIKIPGTRQGLPAVEEAIAEGINVNITLLFSVDVYKNVLEAYLRGLEKRVKKKKPINKIVSVASFFVSRVDVAVDKKLDSLIAQGGSRAEEAQPLLQKAAVANAKVAYAHFESVTQSKRFKKLQEKGANLQRLLWASTGTKDKRISDVYYIEELIGPHTVNTMPPATADAFRDHGQVENKLTQGLEKAQAALATLATLGIKMDEITDKLEKDGVVSFSRSFDDLLQVISAKRTMLAGQNGKGLRFSLGALQGEFDQALHRIEEENWISRIWAKDATVWKNDESHQKNIKNSLGWLTVTHVIKQNLPLLDEIVKSVKKGKFTHVLLLGMGGSSLCPEVLRLTFGKKSGFPDLAILDSTEPDSVAERASRAKPEKTLFIVASKSGTTTEPNAFFSTFYDQVKKKKGKKAGENFIAITDPGTAMESLAKSKKFRHIVLNPSDIGGRYSALSFFGMLPAAIMGIDVDKLLQRARLISGASSPMVPIKQNPGVLLGAVLGVAASHGRNKVTFTLSKGVSSFGTWAEQLLAESTGKEGRGILPVESEPPQNPSDYKEDRIFVSIRLEKEKDSRTEKGLKALEKAGHPVVRITLKDKFDIGGEFFRWEMATAVAGALLGINPFDQPNVQEAKILTKQLISEYKTNKGFPKEKALFEKDGVSVYGANGSSRTASLEEALQSFLSQASDKDYVALLAYLSRDKNNEALLQTIRAHIFKAKKLATTLGFGPRYLHSTGQYHKGGDNSGLFISITADDSKDLPVPGAGYSYSVLKEAQARGDWQALAKNNRRILHIHLKNKAKGLSKLKEVFKSLSSN